MTPNKINSIAVFCGSSLGNDPIYQFAAKKLIDVMHQLNITLVYGGSTVGLMGVIANHMLSLNGKVIGVIPQNLVDIEISHQHLTELHIVNSMHERKFLMAKKADAFIMLPGGPGSLEEFFEIFTWAQLHLHTKPYGILNVNGYYDSLMNFLQHMTQQGFLKSIHYGTIHVNEDPTSLIKSFIHYQAPTDKKWLNELKSVSAY